MTTTDHQANTREWNGLSIPPAGTYAIDKHHSRLGFVAKHMMVTKVRGQFDDISSTLTLAEDPTQSSIEVTIQAGSVITRADDRDNHLRSADFFDAENHPTITFKSTNIEHVGGDEFEVTGNLTIRGTTHPVTLNATFDGTGVNPWGVVVVGFSASTEINREDWGLTWNAALETGGVMVGKTVKLEIDAEYNPVQ